MQIRSSKTAKKTKIAEKEVGKGQQKLGILRELRLKIMNILQRFDLDGMADKCQRKLQILQNSKITNTTKATKI